MAFQETLANGKPDTLFVPLRTVLARCVRLLVQVASEGQKLNFSVPTGNFGDVFAGFLAKKMGLPIDKLIVATNENDILERFFRTGEYKKGAVEFTISPSMDIQVASNFERYLYYRFDGDSAAVRKALKQFTDDGVTTVPLVDGVVDPTFLAGRGGTPEVMASIKKYKEEVCCGQEAHSCLANACNVHLESCMCYHISIAFPAFFSRFFGRGRRSHTGHIGLGRLGAWDRRAGLGPQRGPEIHLWAWRARPLAHCKNGKHKQPMAKMPGNAAHRS